MTRAVAATTNPASRVRKTTSDKWWQVTEIRAAAVAGLLLVAALVVGWTDGPHPVKLTLEAWR